jgi:hypothetical protein
MLRAIYGAIGKTAQTFLAGGIDPVLGTAKAEVSACQAGDPVPIVKRVGRLEPL